MLIFYSFHCFYFIIGIWSVIYGNILIVQSSSFSSSGRLTPKGSSSDNPRFSFVGTKSQAKRQLGKLSLFQKLSFQWVDELIQRDNRIPLQLVDLWSIDDSVTDKSCRLFQKYFDSENSVAIDNTYSHNSNVHPTSSSSRRKQKSYSFLSNIPKGSTLTELWSSPVTRALAKMYQKELIYSGLLKLIKAGLNLLPSLLVSAILSAVESTVTHDKSFSQIILEEDTSINSIFHKLIKLFGSICIQRFDAIGYTFLLLFVLCTKTLVDSQYFDRAVNLGASVRSTLAAVVYRKSAQLTPASRQNNTVSICISFLNCCYCFSM